MNQLDTRRQEIVRSVLDDGMRLSTANLHDDPGACLNAADFLGDVASELLAPILIYIFHGDLPFRDFSSTSGAASSVSWPISSSKL